MMNSSRLKTVVIVGNTVYVYLVAMVLGLLVWYYKDWVKYLKENILKHTDGYLTLLAFLLGIVILSFNIIFLIKSKEEDASELARYNMLIRIIQLPADFIIYETVFGTMINLFFDSLFKAGSALSVSDIFVFWLGCFAIISMGLFACVVFRSLREEGKLSLATQIACSFFSFFIFIDVIFAIVGYIWSKS